MSYQKSFINFHETVGSSIESKEEIMRGLNEVFEKSDERQQLIRVIDYLGVWQSVNVDIVDKELIQAGMLSLAKSDFTPNGEDDLLALKEFLMRIINRYIIVDSSMSNMMNLDSKERFVPQEELFPELDALEIEELNMGICELHNVLNAVSMEDDENKGCDFLKDIFGDGFIAA